VPQVPGIATATHRCRLQVPGIALYEMPGTKDEGRHEGTKESVPDAAGRLARRLLMR